MAKDKTKAEFTIQLADNGMMVSGIDCIKVFEDTHVIGGTGKENLIHQLGKILYDEIDYAMNQMLSCKVKMSIEFTNEED